MGKGSRDDQIKEIEFDVARSLFQSFCRMNFPAGDFPSVVRSLPGAFALVLLVSCGKEPDGNFVGEISDWQTEVFEAKALQIEKQDYSLRLTLRQVGEERPAELVFRHLDSGREKIRAGEWMVGDGNRTIAFPDGEQVQEYYLYKQGARFIFQDSWGLSDDNGSLIRLMRNKGKSQKRSFRLAFNFESDGKALFVSKAFPKGLNGEWEMIEGRVVANFLDEVSGERQKYYMSWNEGNLQIDNLTMYMPFYHRYFVRLPEATEGMGPMTLEDIRKGLRSGKIETTHLASTDNRKWIPVSKIQGLDKGTKQLRRKNWMYTTKFDEPPILKPR